MKTRRIFVLSDDYVIRGFFDNQLIRNVFLRFYQSYGFLNYITTGCLPEFVQKQLELIYPYFDYKLANCKLTSEDLDLDPNDRTFQSHIHISSHRGKISFGSNGHKCVITYTFQDGVLYVGIEHDNSDSVLMQLGDIFKKQFFRVDFIESIRLLVDTINTTYNNPGKIYRNLIDPDLLVQIQHLWISHRQSEYLKLVDQINDEANRLLFLFSNVQ